MTSSVAIPVRIEPRPKLATGWHSPGRAGDRIWRWTDGNALLPVPAGTTMIEIRVAGTARYPLDTDRPVEAAATVANWRVTGSRWLVKAPSAAG